MISQNWKMNDDSKRGRFGFGALNGSVAAGLAMLGFSVGCTERGAVVPAGAPEIQVITVKAARQAVSETLPQVGTIAPNEMVEIKAETDGIIEEVKFEEGQQVKMGAVLILLEQSKLAAALAEAEANYNLSKANYDRAKQLFRDHLISQQEFEQAGFSFSLNEATVELRKQQLGDTRVTARFDGLVGSRLVSPGQVISRNTTLTWLFDDDPVKVEFEAPERFLGQLRDGQSTEVTVAAYGDRRFRGEVFYVAPYVDQDTRTALVKARIPNPKHELKAGMFANLDLTLRVREDSVVIPEVALHRVLSNERATIWVIGSDRTATERTVTLGFRMPGRVEVLDGLAGGEDVVVEGTQKLMPGARVTFAPDEAAEPYQLK